MDADWIFYADISQMSLQIRETCLDNMMSI